jgi:hypothetical protein
MPKPFPAEFRRDVLAVARKHVPPDGAGHRSRRPCGPFGTRSRLENEIDLAAQLNLSRPTMRKAMDDTGPERRIRPPCLPRRFLQFEMTLVQR